MQFTRHSFQEFFHRWGKNEQCLPTRHESIKDTVMSTLRSSPAELRRPSFRLPRLVMAGTAFALFVFFVASWWIQNNHLYRATSATPAQTGGVTFGLSYGQSTGLAGPASPSILERVYDSFSPPRETDVPASDTREFLKTGYQATIKTRQVEEIGQHVQTIVRGHGGRIDNLTLEERFGYISFVIPKEAFEPFKKELKSLARPRFISERVQMENLLPQKRVIEGQTSSTQSVLALLHSQLQTYEAEYRAATDKINAQISSQTAALNRERKALAAIDAKFTARRAQLNAEFLSVTNERQALDAEKTNDTARMSQIAERKNTLTQLETSLRQALDAHEKSYSAPNIQSIFSRINQLKQAVDDLRQTLDAKRAEHEWKIQDLNAQIKAATGQLEGLNAQDQNLHNTVATVQGTVSLEWVSIWSIIQMYVSMPWLAAILFALIFFIYMPLRRQKFQLP